MVSDGSVRYLLSMSFGWILVNPVGHWLAAASGPSMGCRSSLRAEGDGMLSGALFLNIIADIYPSEVCTIKYVLDNFELIKQNNKHLGFDILYLNTTLQVEYNTIKQIYRLNKEHNIRSSFHWVKGHQDRNKDVKELLIEAQLNITANSYASRWQEDHHGLYFPILHKYPSSQATLIIQNQAVTNKYRHHLIRAYTELRYI